MIVDCLQNADRYLPLHALFADGFAFLRQEDLAALADGRYEIDGERVFAIVSRSQGRGREQSPLEAHRLYIDIQFVIGGEDRIGWLSTDDCREISSSYDEEKDIEFFADDPTTWIAIPPGTFAVFYPADAHAPLATQGAIHKVIVKVAVNA